MDQQPDHPADPLRKPDPAPGRPVPERAAPEGAASGRPVPELRVSDRERDAAVDILAAALAEGRLLPHEHAARVEAALRAHTAGELAPLTADLPAPRPTAEERKRKEVAEWYA
ncbi:DUF1707 domain-containing protein [Streptomyces sp. NPDC057854]|uniref:DUF1707 SHOCT-like domain-containing protein n=1 Tax=unclassified Streptomyces TaxID=2593676 RepID=UPI0036CC2C00